MKQEAGISNQKAEKRHSENIKSEVNQMSGLMEKMEIKKALFHRLLLPFTLDVHTIYDKESES